MSQTGFLQPKKMQNHLNHFIFLTCFLLAYYFWMLCYGTFACFSCGAAVGPISILSLLRIDSYGAHHLASAPKEGLILGTI